MGGREGLVDTAVKTAETGCVTHVTFVVCMGRRVGGSARGVNILEKIDGLVLEDLSL